MRVTPEEGHTTAYGAETSLLSTASLGKSWKSLSYPDGYYTLS